jgi:hypothetical protein
VVDEVYAAGLSWEARLRAPLGAAERMLEGWETERLLHAERGGEVPSGAGSEEVSEPPYWLSDADANAGAGGPQPPPQQQQEPQEPHAEDGGVPAGPPAAGPPAHLREAVRGVRGACEEAPASARSAAGDADADEDMGRASTPEASAPAGQAGRGGSGVWGGSEAGRASTPEARGEELGAGSSGWGATPGGDSEEGMESDGISGSLMGGSLESSPESGHAPAWESEAQYSS